ncbi:MAG TPA: sterol desaturase family protein [Minicystis sp.]|nr:sterol desaturase family protein [Minicystis sp.]
MDLIALSVPLFFVLIGVELLVARARRRAVYRLGDALTDLSCGITSQLPLLFYGAVQVAIYAFLYDRARLVTIRPAWLAWVFAFVAIDFIYYWWHRLSHEVWLLWAAHVVHHQSEDYNLAVALRQAVLTTWTSLPFYLPLAILGVPAPVFVTMHALSTLYQFWIHTELVRPIGGPVGFLLNMPAHHRVHHAVNPQYLDKNYGATLIVWDRLFGTYEDEIEPCVYGTTEPLASYNPLWAQVEPWITLARKVGRARGWDRARVVFRSPAWQPAGEPAKAVDVAARAKFDPTPSRATKAYVGVQHAALVVATGLVLLFYARMPRALVATAAVVIVGGLVALGALLEGKRWAKAAEAARLALSGAALALAVSGGW